MDTLKTLISFDQANFLKGVTLCEVLRTARKRIYVKVVNSGENYAGIQGSPAGEGFYVNPENILVPNGTLSQFSEIRKGLKDLNERMSAVDAEAAKEIEAVNQRAADAKADLIEELKARFLPQEEAEPAPAADQPAQ